jgi:phospholipid transport system substrate-binding protein
MIDKELALQPRRLRFLLVPIAAWILGAQAVLAVQSGSSLHTFVTRLIGETAALSAQAASDSAVRERSRRLLEQFFDIPAMAREVLGPAWETASATERQAFRSAFEERVVNALVRRARTEGQVSMLLVGSRAEKTGHQLAAVRLVFPERPDQTWIWRLRPAGSSWLVVDLLIEGSSTLAAERDEYARVLAFHHGDLAALIQHVRSRGR